MQQVQRSTHDEKSGKHYVYSLAYPDGRVFYVGKGTGKRIHRHEAEAKSGKTRNSFKVRIIKKIWAAGQEVDKKILSYFPTHDDALLYEQALIFFLPNLSNLTMGGEGTQGLVRTPEYRQKLSAANKGRLKSEETRQKISAAKKGIPLSEERLQALIASRVGKPRSEEHRQKISAAHKGKPRSEETKQKISATKKAARALKQEGVLS